LSPKLKRFSGSEVVDIMRTLGFEIYSQTIPLHPELDVGTLRAIVRQAARYIPEVELRSHFYTN